MKNMVLLVVLNHHIEKLMIIPLHDNLTYLFCLNLHSVNKIKKIGIYILILVFSTSCVFDYDNMIGTYIKIENDIKEILYLNNDNSYSREVYDLKNNELLHESYDYYSINNNSICFINFHQTYRTVELQKKLVNSGGGINACLNISRNIFFSICIEETDGGNVYAVFEKQ